MAGALAQHAVQAKADEHGDKGENDDGGQRGFRSFEAVNIMRLSNGFKGARLRAARHCTSFRRLLGAQPRFPGSPGRQSSHFTQGQEEHGRSGSDHSRQSMEATMDSAPQVATIAQYIKDLSVESPSSPQVFQWQGQPPQLDVQFHINVNAAGEDVHEVILKIDVTARSENGTHFVVDLSYAGLFGFRNMPQEALAAVPPRRGAAPAVPVRPPDHRRGGAELRLPAAAARPDRFRRGLYGPGRSRPAAIRPLRAAVTARRLQPGEAPTA